MGAVIKTDTKLSSGITISDYEKLERQAARSAIAKFAKQRFMERYVDSLDSTQRSGFLIMASMCLLMETLESFYRGIPDARNRSKLMFCLFLQRSGLDKELGSLSGEFYKNVRCGILHQGETREGWRIRREGQIFNQSTMTINAIKFKKRIESEVTSYCQKLENSQWDDQIWVNFRKKMRAVIKNCGR